MKQNFNIISNLDISTVTNYIEKEINPGNSCRVEIQVDWSNLTGTLDCEIAVYERVSNMSMYLLAYDDSTEVCSTASGNHIFLWPDWMGDCIKIRITKNNTTGGIININCSIK